MNFDTPAGTVALGALVFAVIGLLVYWLAGSRAAFLIGIRQDAPWFLNPAGGRTQGLVFAYLSGLVAVGALVFLAARSVGAPAPFSWTCCWSSAAVALWATITRAGRKIVDVATDGRATWDDPQEQDFVEPDDALDDVDLRTARAAALAGDWRPAAHLLSATADHDARYARVVGLADAALRRRTWLDTWLREHPSDPQALAVRAQLAAAYAWSVRGSAYEVQDPSRWFEAIHDAEAIVREAVAAAPADPSPRTTLVLIARGQQVDHDELDRRLADVLALAPQHLAAHEHALQYKAAKWFGSTDEMFTFARAASAQADPGSALNLLVVTAHVEHWLALSGKSSHLASKHMEAPATRAEITAAVDRWRAGDGGPSPVGRAAAHNLLAFAYWLAEQPDEAVEHLAVTRERLSDMPWGMVDEATAVHARVQAWARQKASARPSTGGLSTVP
ncbi:hypothetical protein [Cellulomonas sp. URHB0016]